MAWQVIRSPHRREAHPSQRAAVRLAGLVLLAVVLAPQVAKREVRLVRRAAVRLAGPAPQGVVLAPQAQKPQPPSTLADFLTVRRASASAFVRSIAKQPLLSESDLSCSLELIRNEPSKLGKALELARAMIDVVPLPAILVRWLEHVVRSQADALHDWARDPAQDTASTLGELAAWAQQRLQEKGGSTKRRDTEHCLLIGINVLLATRGLTPLQSLRVFEGMIKTRKARGETFSPEQHARKLIAGASTRQLVDLARIRAGSETSSGFFAGSYGRRPRVQSRVSGLARTAIGVSAGPLFRG